MTSPVATVSSGKADIPHFNRYEPSQRGEASSQLTLRFFDGVADAQSVAHVVKGLVAGIAPLVDVVTGAGPDQVVQCIIACPYSPNGAGQRSKDKKTPARISKTGRKLVSPKPATWAPRPRELPGASRRSARLLNCPSARLKTRLEAKTGQKSNIFNAGSGPGTTSPGRILTLERRQAAGATKERARGRTPRHPRGRDQHHQVGATHIHGGLPQGLQREATARVDSWGAAEEVKWCPTHSVHSAPAARLPDCSSLTVLVMAEPVRAASVAEWEARKRDIRLNSSSFKHFEDSPSLRARITLSCRTSATHTPVNTCGGVGRERERSAWEGGGGASSHCLLTLRQKTSMNTEWPFCVFSLRPAGDQTQYR